MKKISRDLLLQWLYKWKSGILNEIQIHQKAENLWDSQKNWPIYPECNSRSIEIEVLCQLEMLNQQLIIKDDIGAMIEFLKTPSDKEKEAWKVWKKYWNSIDFKSRKEFLKNNPYYFT